MRITKLLYVFSFIFILSLSLNTTGFAKKKGKTQKGLATWYGGKFHGKPTTSGEAYNKNRMTAAHLTLPFGTKVKVTNRSTNKSVIVRINDRGPWGNKKRIIDLSEAAARKIGVYAEGYSEVTVEIVPPRTARVALRNKKRKSKLRETEQSQAEALAQASAPGPCFAAGPLKSAVPVQFNPNLSYLNKQAGALPRPNKAWLTSEITESLDYRQPIALREEELKGYWLHRVVGGQFMNLAPAEEYRFRLNLNSLNGFAAQSTGAS